MRYYAAFFPGMTIEILSKPLSLKDVDSRENVFGQSRPIERVGVFSFARHSPLFYEGVHATDAALRLTGAQLVAWLKKCLRTMAHETGHMFGLLHCVYYQ